MSARIHSIWKSCWRSLIASMGTTKMKCVSSFADGGYSTLTPYISRYFDTATGSKTDSHTYQEIAKILQRLPSEMVFISDCHPQSLMGCSRHADTAVRVSRESSAACGRTPSDPHSG